MDISADEMHTDLAPMNALVQRAGRTARFGQPRNIGTVTVYALPQDNRGQARLGPYRDERSVIERTQALLRSLPQAGVMASYADELKWVEDVHGTDETTSLGRFDDLHEGHPLRQRIHAAMDAPDRSCLHQLVRDANSVSVLIAADPEGINFTGWDSALGCRIGWPSMLSVPPEILRSGLRQQFSAVGPNHWVAKGAALKGDSESRDLRFAWPPASSEYELRGHWLVCVHPDHASYDKEVGLVLGRPGGGMDLIPNAVAPLPRYQYHIESWLDHSLRIVEQTKAMHAGNTCAIRKLANLAKVDPRLVTEWVEVVCALHDTGKLGVDWQDQAWRWQRDREARNGFSPAPKMPIAHTDFDPRNDGELYRSGGYALPHHAVEGALAVSQSLGKILDEQIGSENLFPVWLAVMWAIARHHASRAKTIRAFEIIAEAAKFIERALPEGWKTMKIEDAPTDPRLVRSLEKAVLWFAEDENWKAWPLYSHFVRRLRLADQASQRQGSHTCK